MADKYTDILNSDVCSTLKQQSAEKCDVVEHTYDSVLGSMNCIKKPRDEEMPDDAAAHAFAESGILPFSSIPDSNKKWKSFAKQLLEENKMLEEQHELALQFHKRLTLQYLLKNRDAVLSASSAKERFLWQTVIKKRIRELLDTKEKSNKKKALVWDDIRRTLEKEFK
jgi:hypothetical protein